MNKTDYFFKKVRYLVTKGYKFDILEEKVYNLFQSFFGPLTRRQKRFLSDYVGELVLLFYMEQDLFVLMDNVWEKKPTGLWYKRKLLING